MPALDALFSIQTLLFLTFAAGAVSTAIALVLHPNPLRSGLFLVLNLFCVAVLYLLLNAYFLAAVQVIVYAGAIMVLFLFVIMLLNLGTPDRTADRLRWQTPVAIIAGLALASVFGGVIYTSVPYNAPASAALEVAAGRKQQSRIASAATASISSPNGRNASLNNAQAPSDTLAANTNPEMLALPPDVSGTAEGVGHTLYDPTAPWLFPFEMTSILLLIAVIGSVVLAKRRITGDDADAYAEGKI